MPFTQHLDGVSGRPVGAPHPRPAGRRRLKPRRGLQISVFAADVVKPHRSANGEERSHEQSEVIRHPIVRVGLGGQCEVDEEESGEDERGSEDDGAAGCDASGFCRFCGCTNRRHGRRLSVASGAEARAQNAARSCDRAALVVCFLVGASGLEPLTPPCEGPPGTADRAREALAKISSRQNGPP